MIKNILIYSKTENSDSQAKLIDENSILLKTAEGYLGGS